MRVTVSIAKVLLEEYGVVQRRRNPEAAMRVATEVRTHLLKGRVATSFHS